MSIRSCQLFAAIALLASSACTLRAGVVADTAARLAEIEPGDGPLEAADLALPDWLAELAGERDRSRDAAGAMALAERWGGVGGAAMRAGCEWRVNFALASRDDIELAKLIARRAIRAAADAERQVEAARAANDDNAIRDLAQRAQVVLPLNTARSLILLASSEPPGPGSQRLLELAGELLSRPTGAGAWYETERAMLSAVALSRSGRMAQALEVIRAAEESAALINPADDTGASRAERVLIRAFVEARAKSPGAGRSILRTAIDQPPFAERGGAGGRDWFASTIAASMHAQLALREVGSSGDARTREALMAQTLVLFERLATQARSASETAMMLEDAARAIDREPRLADESDFGMVVSAIMRPDEPIDTARLSRLVDARSIPAPISASAEIALVRALASSDDPARRLEAARRAVAFSQRHDTDPRAAQTLEWGASLAGSLAGDLSREASITQTLEHAINTAPAHPSADAWRTQLASSLARRAAAAPDDEARALIDRAVEALAQRGTPDATAGALLVWIGERTESGGRDAQDTFRRALDLTRDLTSDEARRVRVRAKVGLGQDEEAWDEARSLLPDRLADAAPATIIAVVRLNRSDEAMRLIDALDPNDSAYLEQRLSRMAWAETRALIDSFADEIAERSNRPTPWQNGAWRIVDTLGASDAARTAWGLLLGGDADRAAKLFASAIADLGETAALTRGLGESLLISGDEAGAFAAFRRLAQLTEQDRQSRDHWHAQTRLAEILVSQNADGSRTDTISRLIRRLRAEPGWNAHEDCMRRLERIARASGVSL